MKLLFGILNIKRGSVARGKVARINVAAWYCRVTIVYSFQTIKKLMKKI
jgi:hypothetical protein